MLSKNSFFVDKFSNNHEDYLKYQQAIKFNDAVIRLFDETFKRNLLKLETLTFLSDATAKYNENYGRTVEISADLDRAPTVAIFIGTHVTHLKSKDGNRIDRCAGFEIDVSHTSELIGINLNRAGNTKQIFYALRKNELLSPSAQLYDPHHSGFGHLSVLTTEFRDLFCLAMVTGKCLKLEGKQCRVDTVEMEKAIKKLKQLKRFPSINITPAPPTPAP